jgi:phage shock protein A
MDTLSDIRRCIEQLSAKEIADLRGWLQDLDGRLFDAKIEQDAKDGKLDGLLADVRANIKAGRGEEF